MKLRKSEINNYKKKHGKCSPGSKCEITFCLKCGSAIGDTHRDCQGHMYRAWAVENHQDICGKGLQKD